jgi:hypothetical protein
VLELKPKDLKFGKKKKTKLKPSLEKPPNKFCNVKIGTKSFSFLREEPHNIANIP